VRVFDWLTLTGSNQSGR